MIIHDTKQFGDALRKRRKELNYTQAYLSDVTGFSASFISEVENGKATAELGKALHLANMLGLDLRIDARA